ncbi:hypothetical protein DL96DRAFT_1718044 [Flagelloscypha sp. PMI_526]|nr:hypothetical protein DL96DRAFT_1718044 [Flagelloscypha sp. PMI_526]
MAEALAVTAVALATPPCIHAITKIWVKIAGMLHLSSPAQCTYLLSRTRRLINKSRAELEKGCETMSPDMAKDYGDKLNKAIEFYNQMVTSHSTAKPKTRLVSLKTAQKASARLLKDIRNHSQKCADEKLVHAVKTYFDYDQNITSPDGTIAAYHRDGDHSHDSQIPRDTIVTQRYNNEPESAQTPPILPVSPAAESITNMPTSSPPRFYIPVEIHFVPQMLSSSSNTFSIPQNPQLPSARHAVLRTTSTGEGYIPPIDLGSARISEVVSAPESNTS